MAVVVEVEILVLVVVVYYALRRVGLSGADTESP